MEKNCGIFLLKRCILFVLLNFTWTLHWKIFLYCDWTEFKNSGLDRKIWQSAHFWTARLVWWGEVSPDVLPFTCFCLKLFVSFQEVANSSMSAVDLSACGDWTRQVTCICAWAWLSPRTTWRCVRSGCLWSWTTSLTMGGLCRWGWNETGGFLKRFWKLNAVPQLVRLKSRTVFANKPIAPSLVWNEMKKKQADMLGGGSGVPCLWNVVGENQHHARLCPENFRQGRLAHSPDYMKIFPVDIQPPKTDYLLKMQYLKPWLDGDSAFRFEIIGSTRTKFFPRCYIRGGYITGCSSPTTPAYPGHVTRWFETHYDETSSGSETSADVQNLVVYF